MELETNSFIDIIKRKARTHNISYPSSAAVVVFGVYLSARAAFSV